MRFKFVFCFAALGAMMALHNVERTGRGQVVDSALYEAVLAVMECLVTEYDQVDFIRERTGSILPKIAPSNVYPTRDGKMIVIGANQDTVFARLAEAMGELGEGVGGGGGQDAELSLVGEGKVWVKATVKPKGQPI